ncbi:hypothetical protein GLAREA_04305 [Glarea lozoyensis ATCC 20868]|uniref:Uncharacterized protein n=2 Tax=Glarea lozoyensis TaxID=101852 RepID=S3CQX2_GLAL2|nr:uncharacterized protein GLAREA_04305 [Glarea lozoyensis ATCC 20868]EHL01822.1 hypothetical protein M7I_2175 [Glarea lozoyensis 74030]EPE27514.1 hypothetical protein GLAREA_04305 [Glarea lozoyensis ATCC 20868]
MIADDGSPTKPSGLRTGKARNRHPRKASSKAMVRYMKNRSTIARWQVLTIWHKQLFSQDANNFSEPYKLQNLPRIRVFDSEIVNPFADSHAVTELSEESGTKSYPCSVSEQRRSNLRFFSAGQSNKGVYWQHWKWVSVAIHGRRYREDVEEELRLFHERVRSEKPRFWDFIQKIFTRDAKAESQDIEMTEKGEPNSEVQPGTPPVPQEVWVLTYEELMEEEYQYFRTTSEGIKYVMGEDESVIGLRESDTADAFRAGWTLYDCEWSSLSGSGKLERVESLRSELASALADITAAEDRLAKKVGKLVCAEKCLSMQEASDVQKAKIKFDKVLEMYNEWDRLS